MFSQNGRTVISQQLTRGYVSVMECNFFKGAQDLEDFPTVVASVEEVVYICQLRDSETDVMKSQSAKELKNLGKSRGVPFKSTIKKADLQNMLVYHRCILV